MDALREAYEVRSAAREAAGLGPSFPFLPGAAVTDVADSNFTAEELERLARESGCPFPDGCSLPTGLCCKCELRRLGISDYSVAASKGLTGALGALVSGFVAELMGDGEARSISEVVAELGSFEKVEANNVEMVVYKCLADKGRYEMYYRRGQFWRLRRRTRWERMGDLEL